MGVRGPGQRNNMLAPRYVALQGCQVSENEFEEVKYPASMEDVMYTFDLHL